MSSSQPEQRLNDIDQRIDGLSEAVGMLVTQFLHPLTQQAVENQRAITRLIERGERHQEWLDEDRHDLAEWRQAQAEQSQQIQSLIDSARADRISANEKFEQQSQQIQSLIDSARADRISANEKFEQLQAEIRQNQQLLLAGQGRLDANQEG